MCLEPASVHRNTRHARCRYVLLMAVLTKRFVSQATDYKVCIMHYPALARGGWIILSLIHTMTSAIER